MAISTKHGPSQTMLLPAILPVTFCRLSQPILKKTRSLPLIWENSLEAPSLFATPDSLLRAKKRDILDSIRTSPKAGAFESLLGFQWSASENIEGEITQWRRRKSTNSTTSKCLVAPRGDAVVGGRRESWDPALARWVAAAVDSWGREQGAGAQERKGNCQKTSRNCIGNEMRFSKKEICGEVDEATMMQMS